MNALELACDHIEAVLAMARHPWRVLVVDGALLIPGIAPERVGLYLFDDLAAHALGGARVERGDRTTRIVLQ